MGRTCVVREGRSPLSCYLLGGTMTNRRSLGLLALAVTAASVAVALPAGAAGNTFRVTTRVTDASDSALVNPWGMSQGPSSPVWVSDNGTGKSTLYQAKASPKVPLTVTI